MQPTIVFDIETIPDLEQGRKLYHLEDLNDEDTYNALITLRRQENNTDFLPLYLHKIICISLVYRDETKIKIWSLGQSKQHEAEIIERFFEGIAKFVPVIVSWNGCAYDLPVLHYRMLLHGIQAPRYWEMGDKDPAFKWNNYLNRYHYRHLDLMDMLAAYQGRANASLDAISNLLALPGKMDVHGGQVWDMYRRDEIQKICNYCETDVLNTYLIYLRFEYVRGRFLREDYQRECDLLKSYLIERNEMHFNEFLARWDDVKFKNIAGFVS